MCLYVCLHCARLRAVRLLRTEKTRNFSSDVLAFQKDLTLRNFMRFIVASERLAETTAITSQRSVNRTITAFLAIPPFAIDLVILVGPLHFTDDFHK